MLTRNSFCFLLLGAMLVTACATTEVNAIWRDPTYQAHPARIMVIGVAKNPINRRLFEDEFVQRLKDRGTEAIASYIVLSDKQQDDQTAIAAKVKEMKADTVLITRLVSKKIVKVYVPGTIYYPPPYYGTWPDYYGYSYQYMYSPGYVTENEYAIIETNLYETKTDKLVWAASSETLVGDSNKKLIRSYIGVMVNTMAKQGLLSK